MSLLSIDDDDDEVLPHCWKLKVVDEDVTAFHATLWL